MAVLGISTNTRLLGTAIITNDGLAAYGVRLHKTSWTPAKASQIITSLEPCVRRYCIKSIVLSIPHVHHQTKECRQLLTSIQRHFEKKAIAVRTVPPQTLYTFCRPGQAKTKKEAMRAIADQYPELRPYYLKEMRNRNRYYVKLFEAVAAAVCQ